MVLSAIGILIVFKLEESTNLITGSFINLPTASKLVYLPLVLILLLIIGILIFLCKRRNE
jgi:hypothetical protein